MNRASLVIDNDRMILGVPFMKVDIKNRTVAGFATLDNVDKGGDIVDYGASLRAFADWPGNIREMHQKIAVGKALEVKPDTYTDEEGNTYDGIWVKARVSKGAEDTWQKVLDGTLSGFSVGGAILEKKPELAKDSGRSVMRITDYVLTELSLVDNPANQYATISLAKSVDGLIEIGTTIDDLGEDDSFEKVTTASLTHDDEQEILSNIGGENMSEREDEVLQKDADMEESAHGPDCTMDEGDHLDKAIQEVNSYVDHVRAGGTDRTHHAADGMHMVGQLADMKRSSAYAKIGKSIEGEDLLNNNNSDISKEDTLSETERGMFRKFIDFIKGTEPEAEKETLEKAVDDTQDETEGGGEELKKELGGDIPEMNKDELMEALTEVVGDLSKSLDEKFVAVGESLAKADEKFASLATAETVEALTKSLEEVAGRVAALENSGAAKKSADAGAAAEKELEKSDKGFWSDSIVPEFLQKKFN